MSDDDRVLRGCSGHGCRCRACWRWGIGEPLSDGRIALWRMFGHPQSRQKIHCKREMGRIASTSGKLNRCISRRSANRRYPLILHGGVWLSMRRNPSHLVIQTVAHRGTDIRPSSPVHRLNQKSLLHPHRPLQSDFPHPWRPPTLQPGTPPNQGNRLKGPVETLDSSHRESPNRGRSEPTPTGLEGLDTP